MEHTKEISFDRTTKDFAVKVDGELIGFAATPAAGRSMADQYVDGLLAMEARFIAEEAAALAAPVAEPASVGAPTSPIVLANITRQSVAAVLVEARRKVADNRRWATALAKAATELEASAWYFTGAGVLVIASRTTPGKKYHVTDQGCECLAAQKGTPCWHKAAARLLTRAAEHSTQPVA